MFDSEIINVLGPMDKKSADFVQFEIEDISDYSAGVHQMIPEYALLDKLRAENI